jgi:hypothetical protein
LQEVIPSILHLYIKYLRISQERTAKINIATQHQSRYYPPQQLSTLLLWWIRAQP